MSRIQAGLTTAPAREKLLFLSRCRILWERASDTKVLITKRVIGAIKLNVVKTCGDNEERTSKRNPGKTLCQSQQGTLHRNCAWLEGILTQQRTEKNSQIGRYTLCRLERFEKRATQRSGGRFVGLRLGDDRVLGLAAWWCGSEVGR